MMVVCSFVSGLCNGLFGIGGPLMVLIILAACDSMDEYIGNIGNPCLLITDIYCLGLRAQRVFLLSAPLLALLLLGIIAILLKPVV